MAQTFKDFRAAILLNQVQEGTVLSRRSQEYIQESKYATFATQLHQYIAYREAFALGLSVIEYDAASKAALEINALYRELLEML